MGLFRAQQTTYSGIKGVNRLLETLRATDSIGPCNFSQREYSTLQDMLDREAELGDVLRLIEGKVSGDKGLSE